MHVRFRCGTTAAITYWLPSTHHRRQRNPNDARLAARADRQEVATPTRHPVATHHPTHTSSAASGMSRTRDQTTEPTRSRAPRHRRDGPSERHAAARPSHGLALHTCTWRLAIRAEPQSRCRRENPPRQVAPGDAGCSTKNSVRTSRSGGRTDADRAGRPHQTPGGREDLATSTSLTITRGRSARARPRSDGRNVTAFFGSRRPRRSATGKSAPSDGSGAGTAGALPRSSPAAPGQTFTTHSRALPQRFVASDLLSTRPSRRR
ncbi:UNVERIFIED_ORG: hypothetical protein CLV66_109150 [Actinomadura viridilutea]